MKGTVTLSEALKQLDSGEYFQMMVISADEKKKSGGKEIWIDRACKYINPGIKNLENISAIEESVTRVLKNPNHYENATRNIQYPNGDINTIHIRLIRVFNNKTVL